MKIRLAKILQGTDRDAIRRSSIAKGVVVSRNYLIIPVLLSCFVITWAAELKHLGILCLGKVPQHQQKPIAVTSNEYGVLVIESSIPKLEIQTTNRIIAKTDSVSGFYVWRLAAGTHVITFSAEGYAPFITRLTMYTEREKQVQQFRLTESLIPQYSEDPSQIVLNYVPSSPDESIFGQMDEKPLSLDFSRGSVVLQPMPGLHSLKVFSTRGTWEEVLTIGSTSQRIERSIVLDSTRAKPRSATPNAIVAITSDPEGARVVMNSVVAGQTPWTGMSVPPGYYKVELFKDGYYPYSFAFPIGPAPDSTGSGHKPDPGQEIIQFPPCPLVKKYGTLRVTSVPSGAGLTVNGKAKGMTPLDSLTVEPGVYKILLEAPGYFPLEKEVTVGSDVVTAVPCSLKRHCGVVSIRSQPDSAVVLVNGIIWGATPLKLDTVQVGKYQVQLRKRGKSDLRFPMEVSLDDTFSTLEVLEENYSTVSIDSRPRGAAVTVQGPTNDLDKKKPLQTATSKLQVLSGCYAVEVVLKDHDPRKDTLWIEPGEQFKHMVELVRQTGQLELVCDPAGVDVFMNGKKIGTTSEDGSSYVFRYPTGEYQLACKKKGYSTYKKTVTIPLNDKITIRPRLTK